MIKDLTLVARSYAPGGGGISRVARMMARSLALIESNQELPIRVCSVLGLKDIDSSINPAWSWHSSNGSISRFVSRLWASNIRSDLLLFDELSMVRAQLVLPFRKPSLCFFHGIDVWENAHSNRISASRKVDWLVTNSQYTRDRADACHGGFERASVCWLGTETDAQGGAGERVLSDVPTVLILGRLQKGRDKGHRDLMRVWPLVRKSVPGAKLLIVGKGDDYESLAKYAGDLGLDASSVEFLGFLSDSQIDDVWRKSWVFAMPSRGEGFGLVYVEAMQRGIPVIASVHDAAFEVNADQVSGFNVDLDLPDQLVSSLIALLSDRNFCLEMGRQAYDRWLNNFTFSAFHSRFREIVAGAVRND